MNRKNLTNMAFILLLILITQSTNLFAQWRVMNPHPSGNTTYIGSAPSANKFITVTGQGEAIITNDGGATWSVVKLPLDGIYRSTHFLNDNIGWVAGAVGSGQVRIFKTTNGGTTWMQQPNAPDTTKYDIFFISENIGWSVGFNGFIIKTTDGGNNWFSQSNTSLSTATLYGVEATDVNNVYVVGNANTILKSTDGGNSFSLSPQIFSTSTDYRAVKFPITGSSMIGCAVGSRGRIAKTTDGGASWFSVYDPNNTVQMWSLAFNNSEVALACGSSSALLRSTNNGSTWSAITGLPTGLTFYSVRFGDNNTAYLSGSSGYYFKSTDAGLTWNPIGYRFTSSRIRDVSFADDMHGFVVGTGFVARSTDGGFTFTPQTAPFTGDINEVVSTSQNFAVAGCDAGNVIRTSDGGANWNLIATGISGTNSDILAIDFVNDNLGWVAAYNGAVAKTTDGGLTWNIISTIGGSNPWDMDFVDSLYGWIAGTGERIFGTSDGGVTWNQQLAVGGLGTYGISFYDRMNGVAGGTGGNTYYTTDGGTIWNNAIAPPSTSVWGIHIASNSIATIALAACASGYVFKSIDGGRNWTEEPRQTISTFDDVWMINPGAAWVVGNSGAVLKFFDPNLVPVELISFTASFIDNSVELKWNTSSEKNNRGFEIEKSAGGASTVLSTSWQTAENNWERIAFVNGAGTTTDEQNYFYVDNNLSNGKYFYRLKQIDFDGSFNYSNEIEIDIKAPFEFMLCQNYPNPFNPETVIRYQLSAFSHVVLKIFDVLGNEVATLVNEEKEPGIYHSQFSIINSQLPSGVYFYKLQAGGFSDVKKLVALK